MTERPASRMRASAAIGLILCSSLATPDVARAGAGDQAAAVCETRLQHLLYLPIARMKGKRADFSAERLRDEKPVPPELARDHHLLIADLPAHVGGLPKDTSQACMDLGAKLVAQLESYFARRFSRLLRQGDAEGFYAEYQTVLSPWGTRAERRRLQARFAEAEAGYLQLMLGRLRAELSRTRWEGFAALTLTLERWNEEWAGILGADAPGAVLFGSRRVAAQAGELDPVALRIVVFHELAHLADPRVQDPARRDALTPVGAEIFAWTETLAYLRELEAHGKPIPWRFANARELIAGQGLPRWVEGIVASRRPSGPKKSEAAAPPSNRSL